MLQDLEAASSETPSESTFERAENVYTAGVNVIERGAAVHSQTQSYISMAKAGLELVDQASGGQLAASAARSSAIQRTMKIAGISSLHMSSQIRLSLPKKRTVLNPQL